MPFRLSTFFLIFFTGVASLALGILYLEWGTPYLALKGLGWVWVLAGGLWIAAVILFAALCLNRFEELSSGIGWAFLIISFGSICPGLFFAVLHASEEARCSCCMCPLKQMGVALLNYEDSYKHFPPVYKCDKNGRPLFSWRVQILPMMEYRILYDSLKQDEPWNSPYNNKVLSQFEKSGYQCPSANHKNNDFTTNYVAVIGPGTAWREDGPVKLSDLPEGGSHTVMAVEAVNSGVHWAEPLDLTVEEALTNMKTGKGLRISTAHPGRVNVLFADSSIQSFPSKMPISLWRKILAGEVKDVDKIEEYIDQSAPDMVDVSVNPLPTKFVKQIILLGVIVWLISVGLLFRRAIKSRRKPATVN